MKLENQVRSLMLSIVAFVALVNCPTRVFAWTADDEFIAAATNAIVHKDIIVDSSFGNQLLDFSGAVTDESMQRTIAIVDAFRKLCLFEATASETMLTESIASSSKLVIQTMSIPEDWQFWASRMLLAGGQAMSNDTMSAYTTLTNAMSHGGIVNSRKAEMNPVMRSLVDAFEMSDISCPQAFEALAGVAAATVGLSEAATKHVNSLPQKYQLMVNVILGAGD